VTEAKNVEILSQTREFILFLGSSTFVWKLFLVYVRSLFFSPDFLFMFPVRTLFSLPDKCVVFCSRRINDGLGVTESNKDIKEKAFCLKLSQRRTGWTRVINMLGVLEDRHERSSSRNMFSILPRCLREEDREKHYFCWRPEPLECLSISHVINFSWLKEGNSLPFPCFVSSIVLDPS
jgi:hypothetical protein